MPGATTRAAAQVAIPAYWDSMLLSQAENLTFFHNLEGMPGSGMPIIRKDDLTVKPGDTIKVDLVLALTNAGTTGETTVVGTEEALKFRQVSFTVDALRNAVSWSDLVDILIEHDMMKTAVMELSKWLAGKIDDSIFKEFVGTGITTLPTAAQRYCGTASSVVTTADSDAVGRLKLADITKTKAYAVVNPKIQPIVTKDGVQFFVMVLHTWAAAELKIYDASWSQAQRDANLRGPDNNVFTGAIGEWDGVYLHQSNRVPVASDGAGGIQVARNLFLGANAMLRGYALYPTVAQYLSPYGESLGLGIKAVYGNKMNAYDLTSGGGAAAANFTAIGHLVQYSAAVAQ